MQGWITGHQSRSGFLEDGEETHIAEQGNLHRFGRCGDQFARGEGAQRRKVGDDRLRLMEGADEILPLRKIDTSLATE